VTGAHFGTKLVAIASTNPMIAATMIAVDVDGPSDVDVTQMPMAEAAHSPMSAPVLVIEPARVI
jgi:hypothetical protein